MLVVPFITANFLPFKSSLFRIPEGAICAKDNVNADARPAVIDDTATSEITIQMPAIALPLLDKGARSPYPTVVSVTSPNHMPFPTPWKYGRGNCLLFLRRSANQMRFPKINRTITSMPIEDKAAQPINGRKRSIIPGCFL